MSLADRMCSCPDTGRSPDCLVHATTGVNAQKVLGGKKRRPAIEHPDHYGGDVVYEAIKVIEAWNLGFHLGNTLKYIRRADLKGDRVADLKKARFYLDREIARLEFGADESGVTRKRRPAAGAAGVSSEARLLSDGEVTTKGNGG